MYVKKVKVGLTSWNVSTCRCKEWWRYASSAEPSCWDGKIICSCKPSQIPKPEKLCKECPRVVILGAGMAGVSAASRLQSAGMDSYTVLEANKRVGGRINTSWSGEGLNELGAEWILGDMNPISRLGSLEGLTQCQDEDKISFMAERGLPLGHFVTEEAQKELNASVEEAARHFCIGDEHSFPTDSLHDFFKTRSQKRKWEEQDAKVLFNSLCASFENDLSAPPNQVKLKNFGSLFRTHSRKRLQEGLIGVFGPMLRDIPKDKIKLDKRVKTVFWENCPLKVQMCDCSEIEADMVLVTFPVGVLKERPELFDPELPEEKVEAINKIGYTTVNKIFLDYAEPFWLRGDGKMYFSRDNVGGTDWISSIFEIREVCGGRNTLQMSVSGPHAIELEDIPEEEIAKTITKHLRKFTGVRTTPYPIGVLRTKWTQDPLFSGSVCFMGMLTNPRYILKFAEPLPGLWVAPRIMFAGEATAGGYLGTAHGARISGFREAQRIIDYIVNNGWPPQPRNALTA